MTTGPTTPDAAAASPSDSSAPIAPPSENSSRRVKASRDFSQGSLWLHLLTFGTPLVIGMGFMALFNLIDIFIVGRLENAADAIRMVSLCDALVTLFVVVTTGIGNGAHALIARSVGIGDNNAARTATTQALVITAAAGVLLFLLGALAPGLTLQALGVRSDDLLYPVGVEYMRIALMGGFTMFFVVMMTNILRGIGNSVWPTTTLVVVNVLNIVLAIVFVLGPETGISFGLGMGVLGAAWAALTARVVGCVLLLIVFTVGVGRHYVHRKLAEWAPDWSVIKRLMKIGLPSSAQLIVRVLGILILIALVNAYLASASDPTVSAAFLLCVKLDLLALFLALGWGQAAGTIMGQSLGRGDRERGMQAGWIAVGYGIAMTVIVGIVFWIYASPIVDFFIEKSDEAPASIVEGADEATQEAAAAAWADAKPSVDIPDSMFEADLGSLRWDGAKQAAAELPELYAFFQPAADNGYAGTPEAGEAWMIYEQTKHRLIVYHGSWYLRVMVFGWIFLAVGIIISQAMTGAGQTRTPVILDAIVCLPVLLGLVVAINTVTPLAGDMQWGAVGTWATVTFSYALLAGMYIVVFKNRRWLETIPHHDPTEAAALGLQVADDADDADKLAGEAR